MKTNDYLLVAATALFSFLFYHQNPGLNVLVFTLVFLLLLLIRNRALLRNSRWLWAASLSLVAATCVFIHGSVLSNFAVIVSLLLVSALSFSPTTSALFGLGFAVYSVLASFVLLIIDWAKRYEQPRPEGAPNRSYRWLWTIAVLLITLIFFFIYRASNPLFEANTQWINFDFISISWVAFTFMGFLLMYGLLQHHTIPVISAEEATWTSEVQPQAIPGERIKRLGSELFAGKLLFILLNAMLLMINAGDIYTLFLGGGLPKGITHSDFVHNGVGLLILSILIAVSLIMFFFRKELHYIQGNRWLKYLVVLWVLQNLMMLYSTLMRNTMYIHFAGLTEKRIGVYVWLLLACAGLCITAFYVLRSRSNWFLIRINVALWLTVLPLSALVDWDLAIVRYNVAHAKEIQLDVDYLYSLSETVIPDLIAYERTHPNSHGPSKPARKGEDGYFLNSLHSKIYYYLQEPKSGWRSYNLRQQRILKSLNVHLH